MTDPAPNRGQKVKWYFNNEVCLLFYGYSVILWMGYSWLPFSHPVFFRLVTLTVTLGDWISLYQLNTVTMLVSSHWAVPLKLLEATAKLVKLKLSQEFTFIYYKSAQMQNNSLELALPCFLGPIYLSLGRTRWPTVNKYSMGKVWKTGFYVSYCLLYI